MIGSETKAGRERFGSEELNVVRQAAAVDDELLESDADLVGWPVNLPITITRVRLEA